MTAIGRLRDGVNVEQAGQVMEATLLQLRDDFPDHYDDQIGHTLVLQSEDLNCVT
jgi:hypothetical protein